MFFSMKPSVLFLQSLDAIKRIRPKRALLIGMRHFFEHQRENQMLAEWSIRYACVAAETVTFFL